MPIQIITVQRPNLARRNHFEMVCICIKEAQHSPKMTANDNNNLNIFIIVASGSSEMCNNSSHMVANAAEHVENEPITWNWNPHATKSKSHSDCKANGHDKYSQRSSFRLMDGENGDNNKRKRSHTTSRNGGTKDDGVEKSSAWPQDQGAEVKDANFWTKVLFGGNSDNNNDHRQSSDFASLVAVPSTSASDSLRKTSANSVIFNSILSNLSNNHRSKAIPSINDITANSESAAINSKAKNLLLKRRTVTSQETNSLCDGTTFEDAASGSNRLSSRMSLHNDLNTINNTFLQALNDLHLDYNDSATATNGVAETSATVQSTSKDRCVFLPSKKELA